MPAISIRNYYLLLLPLFFSACHSDRPVQEVAQCFEQDYRENFPAELPEVPALARLSSRLDSLKHYRQMLLEIDTHSLSENGKDQWQLLTKKMEAEWEHWTPYQNNPALYNLGGMLKQALVQSDQNLAIRLQKLSGLMDQADTYYAQARNNLLVHDVSLYRLASQKQYLGLAFLQDELQDSLLKTHMKPEEKKLIDQKILYTCRALKDYLAFCESVYINYLDSTHYAIQASEAQ